MMGDSLWMGRMGATGSSRREAIETREAGMARDYD